MNRILIPIIIFSFIIAQEEEISEAPVDTTLVDETIDTSEVQLAFPGGANDTSEVELEVMEGSSDVSEVNLALEDIDFSLEFGYKGYQWGSNISNLPRLQNMSGAEPGSDSKSMLMFGMLGLDSTRVTFVYSDSGFWKSEIDFQLVEDIDKQIESFLRIEKNVSEVYGNPFSTDQTVNGLSNSYNNFLNVKYSRAFYRSSWNASPVRIVLVLNGIVQQPKTESSLLEGNISFLRLVYYNPDFMTNGKEEKQIEELPSIFEIY